uniref:Retrotransposon, putative, centromere-specific n=1 Tax=Oryza sativa subsp. japonica TaxID=39947 RepID=Q84SS4_ORYSJ|nr:hypothetical protein [Oryza sativa Japonica Group]
MATTDTTIAHIMEEQDDIKIKSSKCWNQIRPPATLLNSNGRRICIRPPFLAHEYLMESSRSPLSNGSGIIAKFHPSHPQMKKQGAASPVMGLWTCNFIWDPGPGIGLMCTGNINNSRRGIRKIIGDSCAQHRHLHQDMRSDQHDHYEEVRNHEKEERDMKEPPIPLFTLKFETPPSSEEDIKGKLNVEQPLVEPTAEIPLSQVDLFAVPCDKEELCDNASLISIPQLVNEHAITTVNYYCADFKHVVHIANEAEERELRSSLNTLGYVQFDDFCELDNLKEKLFAKSDLPCPTNVIFHIFGEYNDLGIYFVHRVYICSDLELPVHVDKTCKLERNVIANQIVSSFSCFDWKKQVVVNGLRDEHHMEKLRTVFREEGEDDVTMATTDTTIAHIMEE